MRKGLKSLSLGLLVCLCLLGTVGILFLFSVGRLQSLFPESRLDFLDTRIENVSTEFMRRSPNLKANFESFKACMRTPDCQPEEILSKRDEIIRKEWPTLFDRLLVDDDWGSLAFTEMAHERFLREIDRVGGKEVMRVRCVPLIRYYNNGNSSYYRQYEDNGYHCNPLPPPRR